MCLIAWNWQPHSPTPLLLLGNRDEFYQRPALPLHWWEGGEVLGGKDLQAGGTWLGVNRRGWLAALTNYRQPMAQAAGEILEKPSRGSLVSGFLQGKHSAQDYLAAVAQQADHFNPFNLLVFDGVQFMGLESRLGRVFTIAPGVGGVSNADFNTPWPKLQRLCKGLAAQKASSAELADACWPLLQDQTPVEEHLLPHTGIGLAREKLLSTAFVRSEEYGTRASTVVQISRSTVAIHEQSYAQHGMLGSAQHTLTL